MRVKLLTEIVFFLPSILWCGVAQLKNIFYNRKFLIWMGLPVKSSSRVLSIGNLTMGGVGKTPLVIEFAKRLSKKRKVAVVMKSYRGRLRLPEQVDHLRSQSVLIYGDEPVVVSQSLSSIPVPVFSGPSKSKTVRALDQISKKFLFEILIVDDGFQHRRLHRDFDLLVLDATEPIENYRCFPRGRGRENFNSGLRRAHGVIVTRANLVSKGDLKVLLSFLPEVPFLCVGSQVDFFEEWVPSTRSWTRQNLEQLKGLSLALVTGLGRPKQLKNVLNHAGLYFEKEIYFPDHHDYKLKDIPQDVEGLLLTEKDAVKICRLEGVLPRLFVVHSKILWPENSEVFFREVERCLLIS